MKLKVQSKVRKTAPSDPAKPGKKAEAQARETALAVVEQGLKAPPRPRAEGRAEGPRAQGPRPQRLSQPQDTEHTPTSARLFFALKVPASVSGRLAETQRKLKGNWRNVRPDQMHVTLSYLPAVPLDKVEALKQLGTELMRDLAPMDIKLRGTGYFPNEGSPRVWFVKVEGAGLDELAAQLRRGVEALGVATDDLDFKAHITLARKKGPAPRVPPQLFDLGWTATSAALYRSHLRKTGPIYEIQSTFRFLGDIAAPESSESAASSAPSNHGPQASQEQP